MCTLKKHKQLCFSGRLQSQSSNVELETIFHTYYPYYNFFNDREAAIILVGINSCWHYDVNSSSDMQKMHKQITLFIIFN